MLAFSVSSVTRPCSAATSSPGFTRMSMISTPEKSPRSGTATSRGSIDAGAGAERASFGCRTVRSSSGRVSTVGFAASAGPVRLERRDDAARRNAVAGLHFDRGDLAGARRRNVHRRLVGLERDEPLLRCHGVARLHENFDDLDVGKVTKIGYDDFHGVRIL